MSDARVEAAEHVLDRHLTSRDHESGCSRACGYAGDDRGRHLAEVALEAADAATSVLSKDVRVEKIATVLSQADGWLSLAHPSPRHQVLLRERALLIYEALIET